MAKLTYLLLALATLVAFATAQTTIITTTIDDENPISEQRQCRQRLQGQRLNQCRMFLQQGSRTPFEAENPQMGQQQEQELLQQCCQQLQNVEEQCQCEAVKQVFREAQQQPHYQHQQQQHQQQRRQQQQRGQFGGQEMEIARRVIQNLPNECSLEVQQCNVPY
ncbi:hypothetical protein M8C21_033337 [Ambrosia artemisiifolia]|uniref:Bifunctional inhibitor/plant lipid transfer protein/seed storage helical domain-containing protein n=1 Tax=Ambrosia artemisiifolia TaxID=4212 RepID=A0AAD5CS19_AMBAR|nr:hypothetical protein M8C21_033337 [Ambrosia artemisiifolia]